jgi:hypothetical protein
MKCVVSIIILLISVCYVILTLNRWHTYRIQECFQQQKDFQTFLNIIHPQMCYATSVSDSTHLYYDDESNRLLCKPICDTNTHVTWSSEKCPSCGDKGEAAYKQGTVKEDCLYLNDIKQYVLKNKSDAYPDRQDCDDNVPECHTCDVDDTNACFLNTDSKCVKELTITQPTNANASVTTGRCKIDWSVYGDQYDTNDYQQYIENNDTVIVPCSMDRCTSSIATTTQAVTFHHTTSIQRYTSAINGTIECVIRGAHGGYVGNDTSGGRSFTVRCTIHDVQLYDVFVIVVGANGTAITQQVLNNDTRITTRNHNKELARVGAPGGSGTAILQQIDTGTSYVPLIVVAGGGGGTMHSKGGDAGWFNATAADGKAKHPFDESQGYGKGASSAGPGTALRVRHAGSHGSAHQSLSVNHDDTWTVGGGGGGNAGAPAKSSKHVYEGPIGYGKGGDAYWSQHQDFGGPGDGSGGGGGGGYHGGGGGSSKDTGWGGGGGCSYFKTNKVTILDNQSDILKTTSASVPMIKFMPTS